MSKQSDKSHETSALVAGIAAFTTWGLVPIYWVAHLAAPLDRCGNECPIATREALLSRKRLDDRDHLVFVHLGGDHWSRHRNESRLFHDTAHERFARRDFPARATEALAIGFRSARNNRRFKSDL
jgi:hypothetical protein